MEVVDFSRSFLLFRTDLQKKPSQTASHKAPFSLNNARVVLDCVCRIEDRDGYIEEFALGASCKTEQVGAEKDIWLEPNGDFKPIYGRERFLILKAFDVAGKTVQLYPPSQGEQPERQVGVRDEAFDDSRVDILRTEGQVLKSPEEVVNAVLANEPLVATTQLSNSRYEVTLEYPVKTINANERDWVYQTDTGPVLLPNLELDPEELITGMELAYSAFNCPRWTEFIVRVPTPIAEGMSVHHYSKPVRWDAHNRIIRRSV